MNTPDYFNIRVLQAAFCATWLLLMIPNAQAVDGYAKDASNGCAIFKPNLKAGETVTFKGPCANIFGEGHGVAKWSASDGTTVTFEGNFVQGKLQGSGKMTASGGDSYEGDYKDGKREGLGVYTSANGDQFNGQYKDNQRNGHGILTLATGSRTEGEWRNGNPVSVTSRSSSGAGSAGLKLPPQPFAAAPQTPQASSTPPSGTAGRQAPGTSLRPTPSLGSAQTQSASPAASTTTSASGSGGSAKIGQEIRTASGALFRVDDCGFYQAVLVVPPKSLDLRTSSQSGQYSGAAATGGIFPIVREAVEFFLSVCKTDQGYVVKPPHSIFLFLDRLPPPGGITKAISDETQLVKVSWIGGIRGRFGMDRQNLLRSRTHKGANRKLYNKSKPKSRPSMANERRF